MWMDDKKPLEQIASSGTGCPPRKDIKNFCHCEPVLFWRSNLLLAQNIT
jgi:hypothetical protein